MRLITGILAATLIVTASTAHAGIRVEVRDETGGKRYETFDWRDGTEGRRAVAQERIVSTVESALQSKGLIRVHAEADLHVMTHVLVNRHELAELDDADTWEYWSGVNSVDAFDLRAGTLVVDLIDQSQGRRVWRGVGSTTVKGPVEKNLKIIGKLVRKMLGEFSPE